MNSKILLSLLLLFSQISFANPVQVPPPPMPKAFDTLKPLIGTWQGMNKMGDKEEMVTVVYELTSGGSAIAERLMPGAPHEMITVYHRDGKTLGLTHYCALGNHPYMKLKKSDDKTVAFEMMNNQGLTSANEPHMHAVTLTLLDSNTLKQEWTYYNEGKKTDTVTFLLKRKS